MFSLNLSMARPMKVVLHSGSASIYGLLEMNKDVDVYVSTQRPAFQTDPLHRPFSSRENIQVVLRRQPTDCSLWSLGTGPRVLD